MRPGANITREPQLNSVKNSGPLAWAGDLSILFFAELYLVLKLWQERVNKFLTMVTSLLGHKGQALLCV